MIYLVDKETRIESIPVECTSIHLVRPIKAAKLKQLIERCELREISASPSTFRRLNIKAMQLIEGAGITILQEKRKGRPLDIELNKILEINELKNDYKSLREISRITGIPKSTIHYLVKYAAKNKVKKGRNSIHVKN
ncbi:MAG: hypothetical protein AB1467_01465 [Candidatus Diapherotrites archaeon]